MIGYQDALRILFEAANADFNTGLEEVWATGPLKSREGIGCEGRKAKARPSSASKRGLLGTEIMAEAVLAFSENTKVGMAGERAMNRG